MAGVEILDLAAIAARLGSGDDPLGDRLLRGRGAEHRRDLGATYTPPAIVSAMVAFAAAHIQPARVVDAGAGSGRFAIAAARTFPAAEIVAVEVDRDTVEILRTNLAALGLAGRVRVEHADYCEVALPPCAGPTLFIGNPPYVRHHRLERAARCAGR